MSDDDHLIDGDLVGHEADEDCICGPTPLLFASNNAGVEVLECRRCETTWYAPPQQDPEWRRRK